MSHWKNKAAGLLDDERHDANPYGRRRSGNKRWIESAYGPWTYRCKNNDPWVIVRRLDADSINDDKLCLPYAWDPKRRDWSKKAGLPKGPRILFNLPELCAADPSEPVFFLEGEKKAEITTKLGLIATTAIQGACNSTPEAMKDLRDRIVYILPDNDDKGRRHAIKVATQLHGIAKEVRIVPLPRLEPGEDLEEWLDDRGGSKVELLKLASESKVFEPVEDSVGIENFVAYLPEHRYIFMPTGALWPAAGVNARIHPVGDKPASVWLDNNARVEQMTWCPGEPTLIKDKLFSPDGAWVKRPGCTTYNLYQPPTIEPGDADGAGPWVDLVGEVYPDDAEHIMNYLAHRRQRPDEKINHMLFLGGTPGIGKDSILEAVRRAIGDLNFHAISPGAITNQFNPYLQSVVLLITELRDLGDSNRVSFYEATKWMLASPPAALLVNDKYAKHYYVPNVCGVIATTNHKTDGLYLPADDRRHYIAWSELEVSPRSSDQWKEYYRWLDDGGDRHVTAFLDARDLSGFDPKAPPEKTEAFWEIVNASLQPEESELADVLESFAGGAVTIHMVIKKATDSHYDELCRFLLDRTKRRVITGRMEKAGYTAVRNQDAKDGHWKIGGRRCVAYIPKGLSATEAAKRVDDMIKQAEAEVKRIDDLMQARGR